MSFWLSALFLMNSFIALIIIFRETRDVSSTWAWLVVLIGLPGLGLLLYLFIGKKISQDNIFDLKNEKKLGLKTSASEQKIQLKANTLVKSGELLEEELVDLFLNVDEAVYSTNNNAEVFVDGKNLFESILKDIEEAKHHIHVQYYIFNNDKLGRKIMEALYHKAKEGIEVIVLYDALGSRTLRPSFFRKLIKNGGIAVPFFGSAIPFVNLRMNHRNHRKIVVIDGQIGYTGGFNIGDEYLGLGKLGYWRDTHLRLQGEVVHALQARFFLDFNATVKPEMKKQYLNQYFPPVNREVGFLPMQIVSSGPESDVDQIKLGFLKMITSAKKTIHLQTPYFIPDQSLMDALEIAMNSGVEVNIMIPCKPDHMVVYRATEYYAKWASQLGANIYIYQKGFLHSKVLLVDGQIASVGTANFDIRSFSLNFEVNIFAYDHQFADRLLNDFINDAQECLKVDENYFKQQSIYRKVKQALARLFSPIL